MSDDTEGETIARESRPIQQATLYYLPKTSELVIRTPHSLVDGVGMQLLWHTYLTALTSESPRTDLVFGGETARLPPSLEKALGHPDVPREEVAHKGMQIAAEAMSSMPGIGPVNRVGTVPSGPTQRRELVFSEQTTEAIVRACKHNGYSVTAAVHAALALTVIKHADPAHTNEKSKYVTVNSFSLRSHLPEPYSSSQYAVALYYAIWPLILEKPDTFNDLVHEIDDNYKTTFNGNAENMELCGSVTSGLRDIVQTPEFLTAPPVRDALMSSLGVVERYLHQSYGSADDRRRVTVQDFKSGIEVILGHSMCFLYTFRGQMRLVYSFNEAYEEEALVQGYLEDVQKILLEELTDVNHAATVSPIV